MKKHTRWDVLEVFGDGEMMYEVKTEQIADYVFALVMVISRRVIDTASNVYKKRYQSKRRNKVSVLMETKKDK